MVGGGGGEAKVSERSAAKVCVDKHRIRVEDLVDGVDCGIRRFAVNRWDRGVFESLNELIDRDDFRGGGGGVIDNRQ